MKYFTPELYMMGQAEDDETANEADRLWDEALERYERRLEEIRPELPEHVRAFNELLLHDAVVESMYRVRDKLVFVALKDIPPRDLVTMTYTLAAEPVINKEALAGEGCEVMEFMYDELDVMEENGQKVFTQSILFSNGWEVQLRFRDVEVVIAEPIYPAPAPAPSPALPQTA